ncbi:MAG TPA: PAS domain S-box protein [Gemmatimonadaceae bacterium]|nr:PAS domain S-box protein [Gemmatimonadaceae bacterium]
MAIDPIEAISPLASSVEKVRIGIGVLSGDERWLDANQRLCELLGYSREELLNLERVDTTHPGDVDAEWLELERVRKGETGSTQLEERYQLKNGNSVWVSVTAARTRTDDPRATELLLVVQDLTTRRESQRGLSVQHLVSQIIAEAKSPPETLQTVLAEVGRTLRWSYATYWALDHTANVLRPVRTWMPSDRVFVEFDRKTKGIVFGRGEGFPGRVLESGRPNWESDLAVPPVYPRSGEASAEGLHSAFGIPVRTADRFFGVLEFFAEDVLPPDQALLNAAQGVGYQLGEFLERARAREAEHESEVRKASILDTALDSIITSDETGRITEFNAAAEAAFGYKKAEVIGRQMADLIIPHRYRERHREGMKRYLATGEAHVLGRRIEIEALRADGSELPVELAIVRVPLPGPAFFTAYIRDLTERKRLEADQARLLKESEEANRAKSEFLATMSHELRTPLNAISGYTELLKMGLRGPVTEEQVADLERINRSQSHLLGIINDILQFAKLESGPVEMTVDEFPVETALDTAEELVRPQLEAKRISYARLRGDKSARVRADSDRFQQIVLNLLSNALKFTPEGGRITVAWRIEQQRFLIDVADTGIGIAVDQFERIFDPFVQVQSGTTRTSEGVGLGLAISRDMARQMGGDVYVTSELGNGSTFTLALPQAL